MVRNELTCTPPPQCSLATWKEKPNGCSAPEWIGWAVPSEATNACDMHDLCYAAGRSQSKCDDDFYDNLVESGVDLITAAIMTAAVRGTDNSESVNWGKANCLGSPIELKSLENNECLDMNLDGSKNVYGYPCHGLNNQKWYYNINTKQIMSAHNYECLDMHYDSKNVYVHPCHGDKNQKWTIIKTTKEIKSDWNNQCLDMHLGAGHNIYVHPCHGGNNQKWTGFENINTNAVSLPALPLPNRFIDISQYMWYILIILIIINGICIIFYYYKRRKRSNQIKYKTVSIDSTDVDTDVDVAC